jgi:hypothetical protein
MCTEGLPTITNFEFFKIQFAKNHLSLLTVHLRDMVDLLFEFDAPKRFVDLTTAYKYTAYHRSGQITIHSHDDWFDKVHEEHSKPTPSSPSSSTANASNDQKTQANDSHKHEATNMNRKKVNGSTSSAR